ncbi:uncharacterized protein AKAW2_21410S [Aspergillus luchuensis]|uniref:Uncharacterized protein n=1 Tax=Aspergillus kawachii TaxID=1069201 RepID=A0A7R7ZVW3_ASPKA|nr:uncharacterized protein AKAW2_21410S [Aspergillus luchuensis]BCR96470.1 hypothetical protein AKAW2_21410S [Aspergillus luchuensis]BCS08981.1 hypothetical protein ALUC_21351S [Aspergillus luchuensis]
MSSPENVTDTPDANETTPDTNEATKSPSTTFAGVQEILDKFRLLLSIGKEDLHSCLPWTLADLRDHLHLEYGAQRDRVAPAALAKPFDDYIRRLVRLIDEVLDEDDADARSASASGSSIFYNLIEGICRAK